MTAVLLFVLALGEMAYVPMDADRCQRIVAAIKSGNEVKARRSDGAAFNVVAARCTTEDAARAAVADRQIQRLGGPGA